MFIYYKIIMVL